MKILITRIMDVLKVISNRGVVSTLKLIVNQLRDRNFDLTYQTETSLCEDPRSLSNLPNVQHSTLYVPTRARTFRKLLELLEPSKSLNFVDYGCGKGRVLILAYEYGFEKVIGLEIVDQWAELSQKNVSKVASQDRFHIISGDATAYGPSKEDGFFYFYDPFDDKVLFQCLRKIKASLDEHPRFALIVIHNNLRKDWNEVSNLLGSRYNRNDIELTGEMFYVFKHSKVGVT